MPTTPNHALRYPVLGDAPNVPLDLQRLAEDTDTALAGHETRLDAIETFVKPMAKVEAQADQSIPNSSLTYVDFAAGLVHYDTLAMVDIANDAINIKRAGYYRFTARVAYPTNATGYRATLIQNFTKNRYIGEDYRAAPNGTVALGTVTTEPIWCDLNDVIKLRLMHNAGSALTITNTNGTYAFLAAVWEDNAPAS